MVHRNRHVESQIARRRGPIAIARARPTWWNRLWALLLSIFGTSALLIMATGTGVRSEAADMNFVADVTCADEEAPVGKQTAAVPKTVPAPGADAAVDESDSASAQVTEADDANEADNAEEDKPVYVRVSRDEKNRVDRLETSVVTFGNSKELDGVTVDLLGAIHLGESQYYYELNKLFREYDVLLFEAVMPEEAVKLDMRPGGGAPRLGETLEDAHERQWSEAMVGLEAVGVLQVGMTDVLGLTFQLTEIDYSRRNFVHADMTTEEFLNSMKKRGESFSGMMLQEMSKSILDSGDQNPAAMNLDLLISMLAKDRKYRLRRIAAAQLAKVDDKNLFGDAQGKSTIITERNAKAFEVLRAEVEKGHKKIGVFYGAGHFPDMEKRLAADFGLERLGEKWLTAWRLRE